jgi:hypothetical protein
MSSLTNNPENATTAMPIRPAAPSVCKPPELSISLFMQFFYPPFNVSGVLGLLQSASW